MQIRILPFTLMWIRILPGTFDFDADPDLTTRFFPNLDPPMPQNDPLRLLPFYFDADPDPDPAFHIDADPGPASQNDADPDSQHSLPM